VTSAQRLGLLGGSFDPIHRGHLHVAAAAQAAFGLERVVFMPAALPPHKPGVRLAPGEDRLAMVRLAIEGRAGFEASDLELRRDGPSYTIDTVRTLVDQGWDVYLILGSDNLAGLPGWRGVGTLLTLAQPVIVWRVGDVLGIPDGVRSAVGPDLATRLARGFLELPPHPGRATDLRAELAAGRTDHGDLPPAVASYIRERGLYLRP
jgi:nicotinate-nucleotide adenylyltransferase